jgi:hypothetical protein
MDPVPGGTQICENVPVRRPSAEDSLNFGEDGDDFFNSFLNALQL